MKNKKDVTIYFLYANGECWGMEECGKNEIEDIIRKNLIEEDKFEYVEKILVIPKGTNQHWMKIADQLADEQSEAIKDRLKGLTDFQRRKMYSKLFEQFKS